ncbi:PaaI family thioesterase [Paracoccaceae bacterium GXU_MW_L88]
MVETTQDLMAFANDVIARQPFSRLIGAEVLEVTAENITVAIPLEHHHQQQHGFAHGGLVAALADIGLAFTGGIALGGDNVVTSEFKINYLRPAIGERLIARASTHAGKRQAVSRCEIYAEKDGAEKLCALAQGTINRVGA